MFKIKVSSKYRATIQSKLNKIVDQKLVDDMNTEVVGEIKRMIASGVSPVDSETGRRFVGYKNPKSYPAKRKEKRPVSLYLSGLMLSWYKAVRVSGSRLTIGIATNAPEDVKIRAVANNVGTQTEDGKEAIPARRFIPLRGETYRVSVMRKIKNLYAKRIKALLSSK